MVDFAARLIAIGSIEATRISEYDIEINFNMISVMMGAFMTRLYVCWAMVGVLSACGTVETAATQQAGTEMQGTEMQGTEMQGTEMQGTEMQGMAMQGIRLHGATLAGQGLHNVRVSRGEVLADRGSTTLGGTSLVGAHFFADARNIKVDPPTSVVLEYRITAIEPEAPQYDPTHTGHTFLYTLEQYVEDDQTWQPACPVDTDERRVAIPLAAVWDERGDRSVSNQWFTFGCTTGVIAKCYRWGYRPWVTSHGDLVPYHQTCTRLARADYCGVGRSFTNDKTEINVWDRLQPPIQSHGGLLPPPEMSFEAGWGPNGAVCLSHSRWLLKDVALLLQVCPDKLIPPGLLGGTVCDTIPDVLGFDSNALLFDEARLTNGILPPLPIPLPL
jgi:hypothetical protein